jgi:prepilin-type N-terminal cleavage/methylation domain-containing protein
MWMQRNETSRRRAKRSGGFTLIEVILAIAILAIGVLGLVSVFAQGMAVMSSSPWEVIAKEKAAEAIESVFTARDTRVLTWARIRNVVGGSGADNGVFLDGPQQLCAAGNDGLVNTVDDFSPCQQEVVLYPGADGTLGTGDDVQVPLQILTREIEIRDVPGNLNLRQIRVIVTYNVGRIPRQYVLTTFISSFA